MPNNCPPRLDGERSSDGGFTLVELVGVLLIIAILVVVVMPRIVDRTTYDARAFLDQTKAAVRYAHKLAIAGNRSVFVNFASSRIALCFDAACSSPVNSPSGNSGSAETLAACGNNRSWFCEAVPANLSYTAVDASTNSYVAPTASLFFNSLGRPFRTGDGMAVSTFTTPLTVSITEIPSTPTSTTRTFVIEPETGHVH